MENDPHTGLSAADTSHEDRELARLATIVASSDDAIVGKTLDGVVVSWNRAAEDIYGYTAREMVGRPIAILVPPDRRAELDDIMERIRSGLHVKHLETVRIRKDGIPIDIFLTVSPIYDRKGRLIGASSIARDITEHKEDERRRVATHELLQVFVRATIKEGYLHETLRMIRDWCGCEAVGLETDDPQARACFAAHIGFKEDFLSEVGSLSSETGKCTFITCPEEMQTHSPPCLTSQGAFFCDDITDADQVPQDTGLAAWMRLLAKEGYRSLAIIPVRHFGAIRGVVHMADRANGKMSRRFVDFMEAVTPVMGEAIYRFQLEDERNQTEKILRLLRCDMMQGFYLSRPLPAHEIEMLLPRQ